MLHCRACLSRSIRALDTTTSQPRRLHHDALVAPFTGQRRSLGIRKVGTRPTNLMEVESLSNSKSEPWFRSPQAESQKFRERAVLRRPVGDVSPPEVDSIADMWLGKRDPRIPKAAWDARRRELRWLKDPLEVAAFVKKELGKDKATEMLQLVRMASHSMQVVVSWNHIVDYYLAKERVSDALKVYNEMKKRAQFPDSYTYTILLRGLSINAHHSGALSYALAVYHSMSAPNSRVQPSIIHTNAALRVCARALDMDALWGIAAKIPESGPAAADAVTYTTILNAIRQNLLIGAPAGELDNEQAARRERGIVEGRRIWEDIIRKWRSADLAMEEELVCAMGRLLLVGSRPRDWDDMLSLVEQTMDVPRMVPRLGTKARDEAGYRRVKAPHTPDEYKSDNDHPTRGEEFLAVTTHGVGSQFSNRLSYAKPGSNTLAILLEACQKVVAVKAAEQYWDMLTDPVTYAVVPDVKNLDQWLRLLRQNRASNAAVRTLKEDFLGRGIIPRIGTIRIAMSTCVRDKNNHNSLKHAGEILHLMSTSLPDADAKAVSMYAELALGFPLANGQDLIQALTYLHPITTNLRLQLGVGGEKHSGDRVGAVFLTGENRQDAITALSKIHAVYDRLIFSNLIEEEKKALFKVERARLSAFIQRINFKDSGGTKKLELEGARERPSSEAKRPRGRGRDARHTEHRERRPEAWMSRNARPEQSRKPWFSSLGASDSTSSV